MLAPWRRLRRLLSQAHIYSLGATLKAALEYVAEPAPQLSQDLEALLGRMQAEDPAERPDLQVTWSRAHRRLPTAPASQPHQPAQGGLERTKLCNHEGRLRMGLGRAPLGLAPPPRCCPCPQSIMALCEEKLQPTSSCRLCRSLSAAGRRVLSLESFGALPGEQHTWHQI